MYRYILIASRVQNCIDCIIINDIIEESKNEQLYGNHISGFVFIKSDVLAERLNFTKKRLAQDR